MNKLSFLGVAGLALIAAAPALAADFRRDAREGTIPAALHLDRLL